MDLFVCIGLQFSLDLSPPLLPSNKPLSFCSLINSAELNLVSAYGSDPFLVFLAQTVAVRAIFRVNHLITLHLHLAFITHLHMHALTLSASKNTHTTDCVKISERCSISKMYWYMYHQIYHIIPYHPHRYSLWADTMHLCWKCIIYKIRWWPSEGKLSVTPIYLWATLLENKQEKKSKGSASGGIVNGNITKKVNGEGIPKTVWWNNVPM